MKLGFLSFIGSSYAQIATGAVYGEDACLICEYTGVAETEAYALQVLAGKEAYTSQSDGATHGVPYVLQTTGSDYETKDDHYNYAPVTILNPCAVGALSPAFDEALQSGDIETSDSKDEAVYCVARFFLFHAKDIDRYVYGVKRYISTSDVSDSQVDISHYEGVKGWVTATQRDHGASAVKPGNVPARAELDFHTAIYAANPRFTIRGETKLQVVIAGDTSAWPVASEDSGDNAHYQVYAMDGREAIPSDQASRLANLQPTTESVQSTPFTMCIVCSGSEEFKSQPTQSSQISDPCWNPSGSTVWATDDVTARDVNRFCVPNNGLCKTSTWQYATKNSLKTTSYWVGIQRGCQDNVDGSITGGIVSFVKEGEGYAHGIGRAADGMTKFVRYYAATNTAAKAKDNAKYPDAGSNSGSTVQTRPFAFDDGLVAADKFHYADASRVTTVSNGIADQFSYAAGANDENAYSAKEVYYFYGYVGVMLDTREVTDHSLNTGVSFRLAESGFQYRTDSTQLNNLVTSNANLEPVLCKGITQFSFDGGANDGCVHSLVQTETPQFMSPDGSGPPDLPALAPAVSELECLSCVTPIDNTNNENNCVTAKTALTVKCKTLSCSAIVSNFKLENSDTADTYYYAKRGCTANPEDGVATGDQTQADSFVIPKGYTGIKQTNQRVTTKKANTIQASSASVATIMDCYACSTNMLKTVTGANPAEPTYDSIKTQDASLCWQTFPPQADSSIAATGTSGRCETACYVSAYKYKETTGPATNPVTTFHWALNRGCAKTEAELKTGSTPSPDLYGVSITNYACDYKNGTLCNSQLEAYDTTLQLKTQTVRKIQCFTCDTPAGNTDSKNTCYTVPSTEKATECPDLSYVGCFATETSFNTSVTESVYGMKRGCSKGPLGTTESNVESYDNVKAKTTVCATSNCNKVAGTTTGLVLATGSSISSPDSPGDSPSDSSSDGNADSTAEGVDEVVEDGGETTADGAAFISFTCTLLVTLLF